MEVLRGFANLKLSSKLSDFARTMKMQLKSKDAILPQNFLTKEFFSSSSFDRKKLFLVHRVPRLVFRGTQGLFRYFKCSVESLKAFILSEIFRRNVLYKLCDLKSSARLRTTDS